VQLSNKNSILEEQTSTSNVQVVGIGASAGGLEALELFLRAVPKDTGLAFVIIQHLDPDRKDMMVEILQQSSAIPVIQVTDQLRVEANKVYVIPPNSDISILHGVLHLLEPVESRGLRLPIDFFFRSLADDQHDRSIAVILSGMGSDGVLGLRAIRAKAGVGFVQSPDSAKFDSMPRSAIDAGLADTIAAAEDLPTKILSYLKHAPLVRKPTLHFDEKSESMLAKIIILIRAHTGHDFSLYKQNTIYRRIERRMGIHEIISISDYVQFLRDNPTEIALLFQELLIGVTSFFRDPTAWEVLKTVVFPELLERYPTGGVLRAWISGCSTGEEAYSMAMIFNEALEQSKLCWNISMQIFATDLDKHAIDKARQGIYPINISADVSPERLNRFFTKEERGYKVKQEIREMITFAPQNMVMDPPFTKLDILSCRNLLIYLTPELQKKLLPLFHYSLKSNGFLFLGSAETVGAFGELFTLLPGKPRIYRRLDSKHRSVCFDFAPNFSPIMKNTESILETNQSFPVTENIETITNHLLLEYYSPTAILTSDKGDILYIKGRTGKYLEPAVGKANLNIFAMAREGLRYDLNEAFIQAQRKKHNITIKNIKVGTNGGTQYVDITVQPLSQNETMSCKVLIIFKEVATPETIKSDSAQQHKSANDSVSKHTELELHQLRKELLSSREETQLAYEEFRSANEELQSTNEELQSSNEELTTSKEEMQSMNEELQTVNNELQSKLHELSSTNNDFKNLLNSIDVAILFLDETLCIRRFTTQTSTIFKLISSDIGRPITDIASALIYPELISDAQEVLRTLIPKEKPIASNNDRWFAVRIMPYRTTENKIDGLVITFTDITVSKVMELKLALLLQTKNERESDEK
jgi:two-component system CheB/CheR fusion protein